jgi:hypothetical protein
MYGREDEEFVDQMSDYQLPKKDSALWSQLTSHHNNSPTSSSSLPDI